MKPRILLADDVGNCARELRAILSPRDVDLDVADSMASCVDRMREVPPAVLFVFAGMKRAFSLMRMVRHSDDLLVTPLVVVGEASHEDLIAKHRQLPTRADRYLLMPLDGELVRSVLLELLQEVGSEMPGDEPPPVPLDVEILPVEFEVAEASEMVAEDSVPDAYMKVNQELVSYRQKVSELEQDLRLAIQINKEVRRLQEDNLKLKARVREEEEGRKTRENFGDLFKRLEQGYKDTIQDLEQLLREKDSLIARLASQGEDASAQSNTFEEQLREEQRRVAELKRPFSQILGMLDEMDHLANELNVVELRQQLAEMDKADGETSAEIAFDEKTLVVSAEELARKLEGSD